MDYAKEMRALYQSLSRIARGITGRAIPVVEVPNANYNDDLAYTTCKRKKSHDLFKQPSFYRHGT